MSKHTRNVTFEKIVKFGPTAEEKLYDLQIRYECLQQELNVSLLENKEYKQDIDELKHQNAQLVLDVNTYKEILAIEKHQTTLTSQRLINLDDIHLDNLDLSAQIKEYKQLIKQMKIENIQIKNENEKYKLALENSNQLKQKREEIHNNNTTKLEQKNKELQQEIDQLHHEITAIYLQGAKSMTAKSLTPSQYAPMIDTKGPTLRGLTPETSVETPDKRNSSFASHVLKPLQEQHEPSVKSPSVDYSNNAGLHMLAALHSLRVNGYHYLDYGSENVSENVSEAGDDNKSEYEYAKQAITPSQGYMSPRSELGLPLTQIAKEQEKERVNSKSGSFITDIIVPLTQVAKERSDMNQDDEGVVEEVPEMDVTPMTPREQDRYLLNEVEDLKKINKGQDKLIRGLEKEIKLLKKENRALHKKVDGGGIRCVTGLFR